MNKDDNLHWLNEDNWCKGKSALKEDGIPTNYNDVDATQFDLTAAINISYKTQEEIDQIIGKVKSAYKSMFPTEWNKCLPIEYVKGGVRISREPPLYELNDQLESFEQVKKLLMWV